MVNIHICGEHLLSMRHLLRKTNGYSHTIIKHTKRSRTYGEHLLRILSLLRRTHAQFLSALKLPAPAGLSAQPELSAQRPRLFGNPQIHPPGLWNPPRSTPTGFPSYTQASFSTSTQKGRVSPTKRGVVTPLPDLPETSASPTWVSAAVT